MANDHQLTMSMTRKQIIEAAVTLNGKPARIVGWQLEFATVRAYDGESYEWAWETCERVIKTRQGRFVS